MKKMLIENVKAILGMIVVILGILAGSLGGGYVTSVPAPATLGAISGPDISSPYLNVNGVTTSYYSSGLYTASTTLCSFKSPVATSTLVFASVQLTTGTSTAISLELGKSTVPDATTTRMSLRNLAAGAQATLNAVVASSTSDGSSGSGKTFTSDPDEIFAPNTYLNAKYGGKTGTNGLVGSCRAVFRSN